MLIAGLAACGSNEQAASTTDKPQTTTTTKASGGTATTKASGDTPTTASSLSTAEFCVQLAAAMNVTSEPVVIKGQMDAEEAAALKAQAQAQAKPWAALAAAAPAAIRPQAEAARDALEKVAALDGSALEEASRALGTDKEYLALVTEIFDWAKANCGPAA